MNDCDLEGALAEVEAFLPRETDAETLSDALGFSAHLKEELGDLEGAGKDLLKARSLVGPTYGRYVHELSLGGLCARQERTAEAVSWYREALRTCLEGQGISAGSAIKSFLDLATTGELTREDRALYVQAAQKSWEVLGLPGRPDLENAESVISAIKSAESRARGPS